MGKTCLLPSPWGGGVAYIYIYISINHALTRVTHPLTTHDAGNGPLEMAGPCMSLVGAPLLVDLRLQRVHLFEAAKLSGDLVADLWTHRCPFWLIWFENRGHVGTAVG